MRMMTCREAMQLASERLDRRLPLRKRLMLWVHLSACGACRVARAQLEAIDRLVRQRSRVEDADGEVADARLDESGLPSEARERIRLEIRRRNA